MKVIDKLLVDGYKIVYHNKYMFVMTRKRQKHFMLVNNLCNFQDFENKTGHAHYIYNKSVAIKICNRIINKKMPFSLNRFIVNSFIRCSVHDKNYNQKIIDYVEFKKNKHNEYYININKGISK